MQYRFTWTDDGVGKPIPARSLSTYRQLHRLHSNECIGGASHISGFPIYSFCEHFLCTVG